jgi:hypothetical protein
MTAYGPPTTRKLSGAGSPLSDWEVMIDRALRHGDDRLASDLREARARVNLATGYLEDVFVPDAFGEAVVEGLTEVRGDPFGPRFRPSDGAELHRLHPDGLQSLSRKDAA